MGKITLDQEPKWHALAGGVDVLLAPCDCLTWQLANLRANRAVTERGLVAGSDEADIVHRDAVTVDVAKELVRDWRGLVGPDGPIPFDVAKIPIVFRHVILGPRLLSLVQGQIMEVFAEGEDCGAAPNGSSEAAPSTADDAGTPTPPAPEARP